MVISTRKRKMMITKLNNFFRSQGKLLTEAEYMQMGSVPYRIGTIKKFLRNWPAMIAYIKVMYPEWERKAASVKEKPVKKDPLEALRSVKKEETSDEDE